MGDHTPLRYPLQVVFFTHIFVNIIMCFHPKRERKREVIVASKVYSFIYPNKIQGSKRLKIIINHIM